jgi:hypothetical protein
MQDDSRGLVPMGDGRLIRKEWHDGRWFLSVTDVVGILAETSEPRRYWSDLKRKLAQDEGWTQLYERIVQLKMRSTDGKRYLTDAADVETLLRIVQSTLPPKQNPSSSSWPRSVASALKTSPTSPSSKDSRRSSAACSCARWWLMGRSR